MSDDELREMFREGRAADRDASPSFDETWDAGASPGSSTRMVAGVALAMAAAVALAIWLQPVTPPAPLPTEDVAETNPLPDLPDESEREALDGELEVLAAWEPAESPTDFLLDDHGLLAEGFPASELDDLVLDFEDLTTEL